MSILRHAARTMLAPYFLTQGVEALRHPRTEVAGDVAEAIADRVGPLPKGDPALIIRANAAVQVGGGMAMATDTATRPAALALAATLIPTTLGYHRFWEAPREERVSELLHFLKNVGLAGGLLVIALDTEGHASVGRRTGRAVSRAAVLADHQRELLELRGELAREKAKSATAETRGKVTATAKQARRDAKAAGKVGRSAGKVGRGAGKGVSTAVTATGRGARKAAKALTPA
jgi:putative oxidoreductase